MRMHGKNYITRIDVIESNNINSIEKYEILDKRTIIT